MSKTQVNEEGERKLVDEDTLMRLIDECKDEEARLSVFNDQIMLETKSQIKSLNEMTEIELDTFDSVKRRLEYAEELAGKTQELVKRVDESLRDDNDKSSRLEQLQKMNEDALVNMEKKWVAAK